MLVRAAPDTDFGWLSIRSGWAPSRQARAIEALDAKGNIRGMVGYDHWAPNSVQCDMAADSSIAWRSLIPEVFRYPFEQAKVGLLLGVVRSDNIQSLRMVSRLGFSVLNRVRNGWSNGVDLVLFELRREDCRWLGGKYGEKHARADRLHASGASTGPG